MGEIQLDEFVSLSLIIQRAKGAGFEVDDTYDLSAGEGSVGGYACVLKRYDDIVVVAAIDGDRVCIPVARRVCERCGLGWPIVAGAEYAR